MNKLFGIGDVSFEDGQTYSYEVCTPDFDRSTWNPNVLEFYDYWRRISPPGRLPGRQHFNPIDIPGLLANIFIREVERNPLRFRARLVGTKIVEAMGTDITGQWLDEAHSHIPNYGLLHARSEASVNERYVTYSKGNVSFYKNYYFVENVTVPLARDGETVDMLAGFSWITTSTGRRI